MIYYQFSDIQRKESAFSWEIISKNQNSENNLCIQLQYLSSANKQNIWPQKSLADYYVQQFFATFEIDVSNVELFWS